MTLWAKDRRNSSEVRSLPSLGCRATFRAFRAIPAVCLVNPAVDFEVVGRLLDGSKAEPQTIDELCLGTMFMQRGREIVSCNGLQGAMGPPRCVISHANSGHSSSLPK